MRTRILAAAAVALAGTFTIAATAPATFVSAFDNPSTTVFINEFHYDNVGSDVGEFVEVAGPAGTNLTGWTIVPYNGNGGASYTPIGSLSGTLTDQGGGYGTLSVAIAGLQNGSPDGLALVDNANNVVQFLSYEGAFTATNGAANGLLSTDIGLSQSEATPVGSSLHLVGTGGTYGDFTWAATTDDSPGAINAGQTFVLTLAVVEPASQTVAIGANATLTAVPVGGTGPYDYQWYEGTPPGTLLVGETNASLTVSSGSASTNLYYVEVTDVTLAMVTSSTASVTAEVPVAPVLDLIEPDEYTVTIGDDVDLTVTVASGTGPLSYEWFEGTPGTGVTTGVTTASFNSGALSEDTSFYVVVTGAGGSTTSNVVTVDVVPPPCPNPIDLISEIQGTTDTSPCVGETVVVEGVVVGDFDVSALRGFYIQSRDADQDADPLTSEGLFVFNGANTDVVDLGDEVRITGTVGENQGQTQVSISSLNPPVILDTLQTVTPGSPVLPVATADGLERFEGMLVTFTQELTVTELFQLGRFGQVTVSAGGRLVQPTSVVEPGAQAIALQAANNLRKIIIDDTSQAQNVDPIVWGRNDLPLSASNTLRGGDTTTGATGVLTYTWGGNFSSPNAYRLRPASPASEDLADITFVAANPRPAGPPEVGGTLKVVGFNVLNYFTTLDVGPVNNCGPVGFEQECRGAESTEEFTRQHDKLIAALLQTDADIFGFSELENSTGVEPLDSIVDSLNAVVGADTWAAVDTDPATVGADTIGTDVIRVGVIYRQDRVEEIGVPAVLDDSVDPTFDDDNNRPTLAVSFSELATGEDLTVVVNHWKSKGCSGATGVDADAGDGAGCWNPVRTAAATAVVNWLDDYPTGIEDDDVLIFGDLNSYAQEDPIDVLRDAGYTDLVEQFNPGAYSYVFNGQWGTLDYAFGSASLTAQTTGADDYHINADEPSILDYNTNFKTTAQVTDLYAPDEFRTSDHDPAVVGLALDSESPMVMLDQAAGQADPTNGSVTFDITFSEVVTGFVASDVTLTGPVPASVQLDEIVAGLEYQLVLDDFAADGVVTASIAAGVVTDGPGNGNLASVSIDNSVTVDLTAPTVTIDQAASQADPTATSPVVFTVGFSEAVTGFGSADVALGGTAGATTAVVTGSGTTYEVSVSGMTSDGTITASVNAGAANDAAGNASVASTSTDNTVTLETVLPINLEDATRYIPLNAFRLFDTRVTEPGNGPKGVVGPYEAIDVQIVGVGNVPSTAVAVVMNLTVTDTAGPSFVSAYPKGALRPTVSAVNIIEAGQTRSNLVTVPIGDDGMVTLYSLAGANLLADVAGYYVPNDEAVRAGRFVPLTPQRAFDTRPTELGAPGPKGKMDAGQTIDVQILGFGDVPANGVAAVVINITGTEASAPGFLTAFPTGLGIPFASNVNLATVGTTAPNLAIVPIGDNGMISIYSSGGTHALGDITGYITDFTADVSISGLFVPVVPERTFDSRTSEGGPGFVPPEGTAVVQVAGVKSIPANAGSVVLNIAGVNSPLGFLTAFDTGADRPTASTVNFVHQPLDTRANAAMLPIGEDGTISLYTLNGSDIIVDTSGYFLE